MTLVYKEPPGASTFGCIGRLLLQALPSLCCRFKGVQELNMQTLEIFYITCYESKTVGQSSCSNPCIILRSFIRHVKSSATISYGPVNNKSSFLKFLSDC